MGIATSLLRRAPLYHAALAVNAASAEALMALLPQEE